MLYNDEETKNEEEQFKKNLKNVRSFTDKDKEVLTSNLDKIMATLQKLSNKPELNPDELAVMAEIEMSLKTIMPKVVAMQQVLGESLVRQSNAFYLHIKQKAEEGDEEAKKVYEELKPLYQASLKSNLGDN